MVDEVRAAHVGRHDRHHRLIGGLRVDGVRRAAQPRAVRHVVEAGHLAGRDRPGDDLGNTHRRRAGLHVDRRDERAVEQRRARHLHLQVRGYAHRLGVVLDEAARRGDGRHRARHRNRRHDRRLAPSSERDRSEEQRLVDQQRRVDVEHRHRVGHGVELGLVDAVADLDHLQAIVDPRRTDAVDAKDLVGEGQPVEDRVEMSGVGRPIDRLDRVPAHHVQARNHVPEPEQVLEVLAGTGTPTPFLVEHIRCARRRSPDDGIAAEVHGLARVSRRHVERARRERHEVLDDGRVELHVAGLAVDPAAVRLERVERGVGVEGQPDLREDAHRQAMDLLNLLLSEHRRWRELAPHRSEDLPGRRGEFGSRPPTPFASADHAREP